MNKAFNELIEYNLEHAKHFENRFNELQNSQNPEFVTVCCSDSRVLQDHMWGNEHPGKIFTCSNIGNRVSQKTEKGEKVSGDLLYPVEHTETDTIIVTGHTGCGAVTATYKDIKKDLEEPEGIKHCIRSIREKIQDGVEKLPEGLSEQEAINYLVEYNVDKQIKFLKQSDDIPEHSDIVGLVYDFQDVYTQQRGRLHIVNINGENNEKQLKNKHPELENRIKRLWNY